MSFMSPTSSSECEATARIVTSPEFEGIATLIEESKDTPIEQYVQKSEFEIKRVLLSNKRIKSKLGNEIACVGPKTQSQKSEKIRSAKVQICETEKIK